MPNRCEQKNALLDLKLQMMLRKQEPLRIHNNELQTNIQVLQNKAFKYEMMSYAIGIMALITIFIIFRNALKFKYRKEFSLGINEETVYEEKYSTGMDEEDPKSKL